MRRKAIPVDLPYQLAFDASMNRVCARGPNSIISQLRAVVGAYHHGTHISFPNEKVSFLMLEAVGVAEFVSQGYKEARAACIKPSQDQIDWVRKRLRYRKVDPDSLLPHQVEFLVAFMEAIQSGYKGIFNASEQGTGKTRMAIAAALLLNVKKVLVVCPNSVIREWYAENDIWLGNGTPFEVWCMDSVPTKTREKALGILAEEPGNHISVINYEGISRLEMALVLHQPQMLILDESWWVKSDSAQRTQVLDRLSNRVKYVIPQGGTPIGNNVGDLWSQVRLIDKEIFPAKKGVFEARYAVTTDLYIQGVRSGKKIVGCLDAGGLMRLLSPIWFRATKATCLQLPPKRYERVYLDLDKDARDLYDSVTEQGEQALGDALSLTGIMVVMLRLQQITGGFAPMYEAPDNNPSIDEIESTIGTDLTLQVVKQPIHSVKLEWLKGWVRDTLLPDPTIRVAIWCRFNNEVFRIAEELGKILGEDKVVPITGRTKANDLVDIKISFNSRNPEGVQVIVNQTDKMCSGHNLQGTDFNIGYSHTWSYIKRAQLEDRAHRIGREFAVDYIDLIIRHSIDEDIIAAVDRKEDLAIRLTPHTVGVPIL